jgi:hypothetical protein
MPFHKSSKVWPPKRHRAYLERYRQSSGRRDYPHPYEFLAVSIRDSDQLIAGEMSGACRAKRRRAQHGSGGCGDLQSRSASYHTLEFPLSQWPSVTRVDTFRVTMPDTPSLVGPPRPGCSLAQPADSATGPRRRLAISSATFERMPPAVSLVGVGTGVSARLPKRRQLPRSNRKP